MANGLTKFKRWTILKRQEPTDTDWKIVYESESFELAKERIIQEYKKVGLDCLMLVRPVDLYTVMYPIN